MISLSAEPGHAARTTKEPLAPGRGSGGGVIILAVSGHAVTVFPRQPRSLPRRGFFFALSSMDFPDFRAVSP